MNILLNLIIFLYFFLPFQFALNPMDDFDIAIARIIILIIIFFYFTLSLWQKKLFVPAGWINAFLFAFLTFSLLSIFITPVTIWTMRKLFFLISLSLIVLPLSTLFIYIPNSKEKILKATVIGATLISIIGLLQFTLQFIFPIEKILFFWSSIIPFFLGDSFSESVLAHNSWLVNISGHTIMRTIAFFPDPHIFSFYLGLIIPISLGLFFLSKKKIWLLAFFILLLTDLLTFSRGGYIGLLGGFIIGLFLLWPIINTTLKHIMTLFIISFIFLLFIPQNPVSSRFLSSLSSADTSNTHRIELWTQAIEQISSRPLLGTGLGAYPYIINPLSTYRTPIYVHNIFLDIGVELGLIGLFLFISIFITLFFTLYRNKRDFIALFAIISLGVFFCHALFDTPIFSIHVLPILLLLISLGISYENTKK